MIKRVTAISLAVFLIFALSIPVFAESSVTIPVSGAWHFNDTLDFSSLSSNLSETVNFLSDGVPYTSMLVTSSSLSYSRSAGSVTVYGDDSVVLYSPSADRTDYAILPYVTISGTSVSYKYYVIWYKSLSTSREDYDFSSLKFYYSSASKIYYCLFDTLEAAVSGIKSSDTVYLSSTIGVSFIDGNSMTSSSYTIDWSNYYSSMQLSSIVRQVTKKDGAYSGVSYQNLTVKKIDSNESILFIGESNNENSIGFADPSYKTIQFGNTPQEVSAEFYSWLIRNASPAVSSIEDANGDGYDDESYAAGEQAGYTVGYADGQASSDSYDLGYSVGYSDGYNVGKDFSQNQGSDSDTVSNFFVRFLGAVTSFLLYLGINISYRGVTILTILFFVIIAVLVYFLIRKLGGKD